MKKALISGISGQDGAYLAQLLLSKGYQVIGTSRDAASCSRRNLEFLNIADRIEMRSMNANEFRSVLATVVQIAPDEIYNLSGQSSVALSFEQPIETFESIVNATVNILEVMRFLDRPIRFYSAGSSEVFGNLDGQSADEATPFQPRSPYALAKATAFWTVANFREAYGLFACTGILFNHESPLRPERFVTQKIVRTACRIARGSDEMLSLGNLDIERDWGWAPEYVDAMWRMLQRDRPQDYIIATGQSMSLADFVAETFAVLEVDSRDRVQSDPGLLRPTDLRVGRANPALAAQDLAWRAETSPREVVRRMVEAELRRLDAAQLAL